MSTVNGNIVISRWLLDTRPLWPGTKISDTTAKDHLQLLSESERTAVVRKYHVADAKMSLASALIKRAYISKCLTDAGVDGVTWDDIEFTRSPDPEHGKPTWDATQSRFAEQKSYPKVDFNVSHQAGLVTLVGVCTIPPKGVAISRKSNQIKEEDEFVEGEDGKWPQYVQVGCDIVKPNERGDIEVIRKSNLDSFTSTFAEVFSDEELYDMTYTLPSHELLLPSGYAVPSKSLGRMDRVINCDQKLEISKPGAANSPPTTEVFDSRLIVDVKLRRFYTFFALKEAYVKLVGEGLLASWIKEAEFRNVRAPRPASAVGRSSRGGWGSRVVGGGGAEFTQQYQSWKSVLRRELSPYASQSDIPDVGADDELEIEPLELWLHGNEVHDTRMEVQAFEEDFLIATMIRPASALSAAGDNFPPWKTLEIERDIVSWARGQAKHAVA